MGIESFFSNSESNHGGNTRFLQKALLVNINCEINIHPTAAYQWNERTVPGTRRELVPEGTDSAHYLIHISSLKAQDLYSIVIGKLKLHNDFFLSTFAESAT